jgi:chemotaxis protein CheX
MDFSSVTLSPMAAEIWASMLGMDLVPHDHASDDAPRTMTGCVQITGDWAGAVTVRCGTDLAREFAGAMFACEPEDLGEDEVRDALGELTNMTGGSVKSLVPGECHLGIPAVAEGLDYTLDIPRARQVCRMGFEHDGRAIQIVVWEMAA